MAAAEARGCPAQHDGNDGHLNKTLKNTYQALVDTVEYRGKRAQSAIPWCVKFYLLHCRPATGYNAIYVFVLFFLKNIGRYATTVAGFM